MIFRDRFGFACNYDTEHKRLDGGDSAAWAGVLSHRNLQDRSNLELFCVWVDDHFELVRHPLQEIKAEGMKFPFNDPRSMSRDNLILWAGGVNKDSPEICKDTCLYYAEKGFVNKDILDFAARLFLYEKSGKPVPKDIKYFGIKFELVKWAKRNLKLSMWWNTEYKPNEEMNQFTTLMIHFGTPWSLEFYHRHPNIEKNLIDYFEGWRNLIEGRQSLFAALISTFKTE